MGEALLQELENIYSAHMKLEEGLALVFVDLEPAHTFQGKNKRGKESNPLPFELDYAARTGDRVRAEIAQLRNILKYAPAGKELGAYAMHFPPQSAALAFEDLAPGRGSADVLARAAPGDDVNPA